MDKTSDGKTAPAKHKITVGQASEANTIKPQTAKNNNLNSKIDLGEQSDQRLKADRDGSSADSKTSPKSNQSAKSSLGSSKSGQDSKSSSSVTITRKAPVRPMAAAIHAQAKTSSAKMDTERTRSSSKKANSATPAHSIPVTTTETKSAAKNISSSVAKSASDSATKTSTPKAITPKAAESNSVSAPVRSSTNSSVPKVVTLGSAPTRPAPANSASASSATSRSSANLKTPQPAKRSEASKPTSAQPARKWWLIAGIIFVVIAVIAVFVAIILINRDSSDPIDAGLSDDSGSEQLKIDYNEKVTTPIGGTFSPNYQIGSNSDFSVRFVDLTCSDDACSNVSKVKFAGKLLPASAYEVKRGSVIIVLLADTMKDLKAGQYTLSFEITEDGTTRLIGLKVKVVDSEQTCPDGQILKDGQCVDSDQSEEEKSDEESNKDDKPSTDNNSEGSNNSSGASNSDSNSSNSGQNSSSDSKPQNPGQVACEDRPGPIRYIFGRWLSDAEKDEYSSYPEFQDGDEIAAGGGAWVPGTTSMKTVNGRCQPSIKDAEVIGVGGGDWLLPRTDPDLPAIIRYHPGQNFIIWYYADGSTELEFVDDPIGYITNHF